MMGKQILISFVLERKWKYIIGTLVLILTSIISSAIPKVLGIITDELNKKSIVIYDIYKNLLLLIIIALLIFILKYIWRYLLIGNCRNLECYLRAKLFKHLQTLPISFYNQNMTGNLVAYAINDIQAIRITFGFGFVAIIEGVVVNVVSIFFMARTISPILTLIALAPVPIIIFITLKLGSIIRERFKGVQASFSDISAKVQENISGIRVIKAFAQEEDEVTDFLGYNRARIDTQMSLTRISALLGPVTQICFGITFLFFIIYGSELVINGTITLGDYVAFNTYIAVIMGPVTNIGRIIEVWQRGLASIKRLDEIFNESSGILDKGNDEKGFEVRGSIIINNLNFSYPDTQKRALKNININLYKGKTLGILGKTGSGKTTLVNLLLRLYNIENGHISIDGVDINEIPVELLREKIGYVPQDNFLFSTTIRNNIEFFKHIYTDDEIEQAARMSGVLDSITSFPDGFDTVIGERGVTLSGGQKQRISIARALVKDPAILILDDSLSAVDTKTENEVLMNIKNVLQNRTGIIISHRVSTVKHADEIIYLSGGRIIERGGHEQLLMQKGDYYRLYTAQTNLDNKMSTEEALT